jgi:hypothetical protein
VLPREKVTGGMNISNEVVQWMKEGETRLSEIDCTSTDEVAFCISSEDVRRGKGFIFVSFYLNFFVK